MKAKLYLIPCTLGDSSVSDVLPQKVNQIANSLQSFIVENERSARRFLIKLGIETAIDDLRFHILNKHTTAQEISTFLDDAKQGLNIGLISEAGIPAVADPGAIIVKQAHKKGIQVVPLSGPSSMIMGLMASGLNGQCFAFNGYLPIKPNERIQSIRKYEARALQENQSQIFIEAPYRNNQLLKDIITTCKPETSLCIACDISLETEYIHTQKIKDWKKNTPDLHKRPVIFIIGQ